MAVRTTLPDTTTAAAAAVIFLFSLQFAASRTPSVLYGNEATAAAATTVAESDPAAAAEVSKFKSNLRLPSDDIKDEPAPEKHVPESVPETERKNTETVRSVPLTRLRFNNLRPTDPRYFVERFGFPGSHCRHRHGGDRSFPTPVVTEIIRYVDDPAIPMEIIRYVEDTAAQPKETESVAKTSRHNLLREGRDLNMPVEEAQPVEADNFAKYVDEAEAAAAAAEAQPKEEAVEEKEMKIPVRHSHHHLRHSGRAHPAAMAATEATAEMVAAARYKEEEKKVVKTEPEATVTGAPVYRSQYNLHRGSARAIRRPVEAYSSGRSEVIRYRDAAAVTEAVQQPKETKTDNNNGDKDDGFSKYMMKYSSRNFQRFGNQKFHRHFPHKRGRGNGGDSEGEKKGELTRIVKRIRKFLDF